MSDTIMPRLAVQDAQNYFPSNTLEDVLSYVGNHLTGTLLKGTKVAVVDSGHGDNATGVVDGLPFQTLEGAISYINTNSLTGVLIYLFPGNHTLTAGITIPTGCAIRGFSTQVTALTLAIANPGGTSRMITMGENTRLEDVSLNMSSSNATTNLVGIYLPGTTSITSKLRTCVLTVNNSSVGSGTSTNVYGIHTSGSGSMGTRVFSYNFTRGVTVNVISNGGGNKRGILSDTANQITFRDTNVYVAAPVDSASNGSYVGAESTDTNSSMQFRTSAIYGPTTSGSYTGSDILQTSPATGFVSTGIQLGPGTDLLNKTAGGKPFTTFVTPTTLIYSLHGNITAGVHYLWVGNQTAEDSTETFYRFQQKSILQGMSINMRTAPGAGKTVNVTVKKSTTGIAGSGSATALTLSISGTDKQGTMYSVSVDIAQGEFISVAVAGNSGIAAQDITVELDVF